jgi:HSP20 family protein
MIYRSSFGVPTWRVRSPFEELDRLQRQMARLFDNYGGTREGQATAGVFPLVNLSEDQESYLIRAELPGMEADKLDIQATGNSISLSGERKIAEEGNGVRYHRREREDGSFSRVITLPGDINAEKVDAELVNGVLTIKVAKAEAAKPKRITVRQ